MYLEADLWNLGDDRVVSQLLISPCPWHMDYLVSNMDIIPIAKGSFLNISLIFSTSVIVILSVRKFALSCCAVTMHLNCTELGFGTCVES